MLYSDIFGCYEALFTVSVHDEVRGHSVCQSMAHPDVRESVLGHNATGGGGDGVYS